jgi:hypothetical protein
MRKKPVKKPARARTKARTGAGDPLTAPIKAANRRTIGGVAIDVTRAGNGRIKRIVYPPGFRWSTHMRPVVGTSLCLHAHVGFLVRGRVSGEYGDGCTFEFAAPQVVVIEPGHDAWVVGSESAVLIQFDAEEETVRHFGLAGEHRHLHA